MLDVDHVSCRATGSYLLPERTTQMSWYQSHKTPLRSALGGMLLLVLLNAPAQAASEGDNLSDIIDGCNQFIKFSRKGTPPRDADKLRRLGECIGAVRTTLAFLVRDDQICPPPRAKLIDAVTILSLRALQNPAELADKYVVVIHSSLMAAWPCVSSRPL